MRGTKSAESERDRGGLVMGLPAGPLDIIADVHGEIDALRRLLSNLGCDPERLEAERPLVFLGDLIDRGPDSPAVLRLVRRLCDAGLATMVLGNHEMNVLRDQPKEGNGWWLGHDDRAHFRDEARAFPSVSITDAERGEFRAWLLQQPLVRERSDLRVAHACWREELVEQLPSDQDSRAAADAFDRALQEDLRARGVHERAQAERARYADLKDISVKVEERLPAVEELTVAEHIRNPVRAVTCGLEHAVPPKDYGFITGKWRTTMRTLWWEDYDDATAVVVGHYWRRRQGSRLDDKPDPWKNVETFSWAGPRGSVFCLDYSVGRRFVERWSGRDESTGFHAGLAAMRWPERTLVFDDQPEPIPTKGFGGRG